MSTPLHGGAAARCGRALYRLLLRAYPSSFRRRFGGDMLDDFEQMTADSRGRGWRSRIGVARRLILDWVRTVTREHVRLLSRRRIRGRGAGPPQLGGEFRQALRRLRRSPSVTTVVILVLALGLGPAIAAYSIANWILFRPIPGVVASEELGLVWHGRESDRGGITVSFVSYLNLEEIAARTETLAGIAGMQGGGATIVVESGAAESLRVEHVGASYFSLLGLRPSAGRFFRDEEDRRIEGAARVAVISHGLATSMFGIPEVAVGQVLNLSGEETRVIGVMPVGFQGLDRLGELDVWMPGTFQSTGGAPPNFRNDRNRGGFYRFVARLAPGATWEQVDAELAGLSAWLSETWPEENERLTHSGFMIYPGIGMTTFSRGELFRTVLLIATIAVGVLAIAFANAAGLLVTHGLARRGEVAIHKALGASTLRLVRLRMLESLIVGTSAAVLGLGLAVALLRLFEGSRLQGLSVPLKSIEIDWRVGLFAAATSLLTAILSGLLPAVDAFRLDPARRLTGAWRTGGRGVRRWQSALGILQVAVTVPLVIGALLFGRSLWELANVELGFEPSGVRLLSMTTHSSSDSTIPSSNADFLDLVDRLEARPEIQRAALTYTLPFLGGGLRTRVREAGSAEEPLELSENAVSERYFEILRVPVLYGRTFTRDDMLSFDGEAFPGVVVSVATATLLFGDPAGALGRRVEFPVRIREGRSYAVIGVVGDVRARDITEPPTAHVYVPVNTASRMFHGARFVVRSEASLADLRAAAVTAWSSSNQDGLEARPRQEILELDAAVRSQLAERRLLARLMLILAGIGAVLAGVGVSIAAARGVLARTREIGVRKALGAQNDRVLRFVLRGLVGVMFTGGMVGVGLAILGMRLVESRLYGVTPSDPWTWFTATLLLSGLGVAAGVVPARRAAQIDPAIALRHEG